MGIIDWLLLDPFKHDFLINAIVLFGEDEVYYAVSLGILMTDGIEIRINVQ